MLSLLVFSDDLYGIFQSNFTKRITELPFLHIDYGDLQGDILI